MWREKRSVGTGFTRLRFEFLQSAEVAMRTGGTHRPRSTRLNPIGDRIVTVTTEPGCHCLLKPVIIG